MLTMFIISQNCDWNVLKILPNFTRHIESESASNHSEHLIVTKEIHLNSQIHCSVPTGSSTTIAKEKNQTSCCSNKSWDETEISLSLPASLNSY